MKNQIVTLNDLFNQYEEIIVPSYQRAYAWEEKQLQHFVDDLIEASNNHQKKSLDEDSIGEYYYGHFIYEEKNENIIEIIDGQQRITTFILFLSVCGFINQNNLSWIIRKFKTVDYDLEGYFKLIELLKNQEINLITELEILSEGDHTLSLKRMIFALNFFYEHFTGTDKKSKLVKENIDIYIKVFLTANISTHSTKNKGIAVQIFELQNTRGLNLSIIEKVKSKLMKVIYTLSSVEDQELKISQIQSQFARIYEIEENISSNSFRGDLQIEDVLLFHLRTIDDGHKIESPRRQNFISPSRQGNKEELILSYLDKTISERRNISEQTAVNYIENLTVKFKESVEFISLKIPQIDDKNSLVGDCLILDRNLCFELYLILFHSEAEYFLIDTEFVRLWERLLFTRDFHSKYYGLVYRDDFEKLFTEIISNISDSQRILYTYVQKGFRNEIGNLPETVSEFLINKKANILNDAFHWFTHKTVYTLYKYEKTKKADLNQLRFIMKKGRSIEHILPQSWQWSWIGETDSNRITAEGTKFNKEIEKIINGIGNLILVTPSENSSLGNNHPKEKIYSVDGGSYSFHNQNSSIWSDHRTWQKNIDERGEEIYSFMQRLALDESVI